MRSGIVTCATLGRAEGAAPATSPTSTIAPFNIWGLMVVAPLFISRAADAAAKTLSQRMFSMKASTYFAAAAPARAQPFHAAPVSDHVSDHGDPDVARGNRRADEKDVQ